MAVLAPVKSLPATKSMATLVRAIGVTAWRDLYNKKGQPAPNAKNDADKKVFPARFHGLVFLVLESYPKEKHIEGQPAPPPPPVLKTLIHEFYQQWTKARDLSATFNIGPRISISDDESINKEGEIVDLTANTEPLIAGELKKQQKTGKVKDFKSDVQKGAPPNKLKRVRVSNDAGDTVGVEASASMTILSQGICNFKIFYFF